MSDKEAGYTEEQVQEFLSPADHSILVMRKDIGEFYQDVTNIQGNSDIVIEMTVNLIQHLAQQGEIPIEKLLATIAVGVLGNSPHKSKGAEDDEN